MKSFSYENLSFYYGKKIVLNNINLSIKNNDVVAIIGPNGVGKTTLMKIIAKIINIKNNHKLSVSFLINDPSFYPHLTGKENLNYFNMINKNELKTVDEALDIVNLSEHKNIKVSKYSMGMKKRLAIAKCLLQNADIYLFDEPLNGLDAKSIIVFRNVIEYLKSLGKIIIISSHILKELELYATKVLLLNKEHNSKEIILDENSNHYHIITSLNSFDFYGDQTEFNNLLYNLVNKNIQIYEINKLTNKLETLLLKGDSDV